MPGPQLMEYRAQEQITRRKNKIYPQKGLGENMFPQLFIKKITYFAENK
jgi:hypothetical protein